MRYRTTTLLAAQALPAIAGTHIIDIPITDVISAFRFSFDITRTAAASLTHGFDAISKIEIVDGSDVLMELSAAQMDALHFFERGHLGNQTCQEFGAGVDHFDTAVYFGRWPYDPELALDPRKFVNPQLRVTYNGATYDAGVAAGCITLTILADIFDEHVPSPIGFLQHREFFRYTPTLTAFTYINLPTDLVLRKLILQPHQYTRDAVRSISQVRLDEDNMKRIPFDMLTNEWLAKNRQEYGPAEHGIAFSREGGALPLYNAIGAWGIALWQEVLAAPVLQLIGTGGCQLTCTDGGTERTTAIGRIVGQCPHFCFCYPFGDQKDPTDWYETAGIGTLRLRIGDVTAAAAPFQVTRLILQQMRRY